MTQATAADKGDVFILAPNDGTARAIADVFAADKDVKSYVITGQDAEEASVEYILDGKQSMTVFKDVRILVQAAVDAALALLKGQAPQPTAAYNNGTIDVPALQAPVICSRSKQHQGRSDRLRLSPARWLFRRLKQAMRLSQGLPSGSFYPRKMNRAGSKIRRISRKLSRQLVTTLKFSSARGFRQGESECRSTAEKRHQSPDHLPARRWRSGA